MEFLELIIRCAFKGLDLALRAGTGEKSYANWSMGLVLNVIDSKVGFRDFRFRCVPITYEFQSQADAKNTICHHAPYVFGETDFPEKTRDRMRLQSERRVNRAESYGDVVRRGCLPKTLAERNE